jgi:hypothetical protein
LRVSHSCFLLFLSLYLQGFTASGREFAKAAEAGLRCELTLVLRGLGVCPPIVLDQRLELDLQAAVLQRIFGQIAGSFERPASGQRRRFEKV